MWSIPLLAEEGWLRHQLKVAKPPKAPQTGAKRERDSAKPNSGQLGEIFRPEQFRRTDHPGRAVSERIHFYLWRSYPSSARRGIVCASSIHSELIFLNPMSASIKPSPDPRMVRLWHEGAQCDRSAACASGCSPSDSARTAKQALRD